MPLRSQNIMGGGPKNKTGFGRAQSKFPKLPEPRKIISSNKNVSAFPRSITENLKLRELAKQKILSQKKELLTNRNTQQVLKEKDIVLSDTDASTISINISDPNRIFVTLHKASQSSITDSEKSLKTKTQISGGNLKSPEISDEENNYDFLLLKVPFKSFTSIRDSKSTSKNKQFSIKSEKTIGDAAKVPKVNNTYKGLFKVAHTPKSLSNETDSVSPCRSFSSLSDKNSLPYINRRTEQKCEDKYLDPSNPNHVINNFGLRSEPRKTNYQIEDSQIDNPRSIEPLYRKTFVPRQFQNDLVNIFSNPENTLLSEINSEKNLNLYSIANILPNNSDQNQLFCIALKSSSSGENKSVASRRSFESKIPRSKRSRKQSRDPVPSTSQDAREIGSANKENRIELRRDVAAGKKYTFSTYSKGIDSKIPKSILRPRSKSESRSSKSKTFYSHNTKDSGVNISEESKKTIRVESSERILVSKESAGIGGPFEGLLYSSRSIGVGSSKVVFNTSTSSKSCNADLVYRSLENSTNHKALQVSHYSRPRSRGGSSHENSQVNFSLKSKHKSQNKKEQKSKKIEKKPKCSIKPKCLKRTNSKQEQQTENTGRRKSTPRGLLRKPETRPTSDANLSKKSNVSNNIYENYEEQETLSYSEWLRRQSQSPNSNIKTKCKCKSKASRNTLRSNIDKPQRHSPGRSTLKQAKKSPLGSQEKELRHINYSDSQNNIQSRSKSPCPCIKISPIRCKTPPTKDHIPYSSKSRETPKTESRSFLKFPTKNKENVEEYTQPSFYSTFSLPKPPPGYTATNFPLPSSPIASKRESIEEYYTPQIYTTPTCPFSPRNSKRECVEEYHTPANYTPILPFSNSPTTSKKESLEKEIYRIPNFPLKKSQTDSKREKIEEYCTPSICGTPNYPLLTSPTTSKRESIKEYSRPSIYAIHKFPLSKSPTNSRRETIQEYPSSIYTTHKCPLTNTPVNSRRESIEEYFTPPIYATPQISISENRAAREHYSKKPSVTIEDPYLEPVENIGGDDNSSITKSRSNLLRNTGETRFNIVQPNYSDQRVEYFVDPESSLPSKRQSRSETKIRQHSTSRATSQDSKKSRRTGLEAYTGVGKPKSHYSTLSREIQEEGYFGKRKSPNRSEIEEQEIENQRSHHLKHSTETHFRVPQVYSNYSNHRDSIEYFVDPETNLTSPKPSRSKIKLPRTSRAISQESKKSRRVYSSPERYSEVSKPKSHYSKLSREIHEGKHTGIRTCCSRTTIEERELGAILMDRRRIMPRRSRSEIKSNKQNQKMLRRERERISDTTEESRSDLNYEYDTDNYQKTLVKSKSLKIVKKQLINSVICKSPDVYRRVFGPTLDETILAGIHNIKKLICQRFPSQGGVNDSYCNERILRYQSSTDDYNASRNTNSVENDDSLDTDMNQESGMRRPEILSRKEKEILNKQKHERKLSRNVRRRCLCPKSREKCRSKQRQQIDTKESDYRERVADELSAKSSSHKHVQPVSSPHVTISHNKDVYERHGTDSSAGLTSNFSSSANVERIVSTTGISNSTSVDKHYRTGKELSSESTDFRSAGIDYCAQIRENVTEGSTNPDTSELSSRSKVFTIPKKCTYKEDLSPVEEKEFEKCTSSSKCSRRGVATPIIDVASDKLYHHSETTDEHNKNFVPNETRFAITKILKYDDFTTYEIFKSTKAKPKVLPKATEGVFVLKNKAAT